MAPRTMRSFSEKVAEQISKKSPIMLGIDPKMDRLPHGISRDVAGIHQFCTDMIDACAPHVCGIKIQMAYFEVFGSEGFRLIEYVLAHARSLNLITMLDGKRNDIGTTAEAYAQAQLTPESPLAADCCTVNPYLGKDGIQPFLDVGTQYGKGVFALVRTSNPSSADFQADGLADTVAERVDAWGDNTVCPQTNYSNLGAVVGATHTGMLEHYRKLMPQSWLLTPGVGAQGGSLEGVLNLRDANGLGVIIPVSRSVLYASGNADYAQAGAQVLQAMRTHV